MRLAFTTLAAPGASIEEVCDAALAYGYEGLEWRLADGALLGPETPDEVWARIAEAMLDRGLVCACVDTSSTFVHDTDEGREEAVAGTVAMARQAAALGAPAVRVFGGGRREQTAPAGSAREALRRAVEGAARYGVEVLVETHDAWSRASDAAVLVEGTGAGILWDVAHTFRAGEDPAVSLAACGMPSVVHVKDARGEQLTHLGEGDVPLEQIVVLLDEAGFDGWLSFEWEKLWHPELPEHEVALPRAAAHLRALLDR